MYRRLQCKQSTYNTPSYVSSVIFRYQNPDDCVVNVLGESFYHSQVKPPILCDRTVARITHG